MEEMVSEGLSPNEIGELEEKRIAKLNEAGIDEREVLHKARENLNIWNNYFNENITIGKDDMNFAFKDQWTAIERSEFTRLFKPAQTYNRMVSTLHKIAAEQRKNKPDLMVRSLTGKANQQEIDLRADLVRTISYRSQNDLIYQTAFMSALSRGYGAFEIDVDYENPRSFNKVINYKICQDITRCSFDPTAVMPHKGDGNFCSRNYQLSKDEYHATYPYSQNPVSYSDARTLLDFQWETRDSIVVCDYMEKKWYPLMLYRLSNGMDVTEDEWDDMQKLFKIKKELAKSTVVVGNMILDQIPKIVMERQTQDYKIIKYRMVQNQILDFMEWPSKYLSIIFVDGASQFIDGKQYTKSYIHEARDAQKTLNYIGSEISAEIKNRRREQWLATPDNIKGYEQMWRNPELQQGVLMAQADPKTGSMPIKMPPWDLSPQLLAQFMRANQDIKEIMGFNESNQGQESNTISGVAEANRQLAGSMSTYIYEDNLNQAVEQGGRVVLDLLPHVIGEDERSMVLSKNDGSSKVITLNKKLPDGSIENEIKRGDYDIEIDTGPSFAVQKNIALDFLQKTLQAYPQAFPLVADLWAKNLDVQFMPQMAERFKTLVPPDILAKEAGEPPPPSQPNPQNEMMQMQHQLAMQELANKEEELKIRQEENMLEKAKLILESKKLHDQMGINITDHMIDLHRTELDHEGKIAKMMTDIHHQKLTNENKKR